MRRFLAKEQVRDFGHEVTLVLDGHVRAIVCDRCVVADTALTRMKGLLGRSTLPSGEGILLEPAWSIHTAFMRFPIDAVFLGKDYRVVDVRSNLGPWRMASCRGAKAVLELRAGDAQRIGIEVGDVLAIVDVNVR